MFFSGLKIVLPEKTKDEVNHSHLDYKSVILLVIVSIIYGLTILKVGYFLTTSLFLAVSYLILGERRWIWIFILSFPFVAIFMFLLHGLLNIYLRDPLLQWIGIIG
jgi:putative tricarboxylic transport membrane protein